MTDMTNIMYRHTDTVEKLTKIQADSDKQLVDNMKQIQDLAADRDLKAKTLADLEADRDLKAKKLADLEAADQAIVEMVEEGEASDKTLVDRLREAPQKITSFVSDTSRKYRRCLRFS